MLLLCLISDRGAWTSGESAGLSLAQAFRFERLPCDDAFHLRVLGFEFSQAGEIAEVEAGVLAAPQPQPIDVNAMLASELLASSLRIKAKGFSLHSLRHFGATQTLVAGNDVRTVAVLLGHADPSVTLRTYGHVVAGAQERAVAGMDEVIAKVQGRRSAG